MEKERIDFNNPEAEVNKIFNKESLDKSGLGKHFMKIAIGLIVYLAVSGLILNVYILVKYVPFLWYTIPLVSSILFLFIKSKIRKKTQHGK